MRWFITILAIASLVRFGFAFRAPLFVVNDSLSYVLPAWELTHGLGFDPLFKRPPLYPLFVAGCLLLFGEEPQAIAVAQHVLGVVIVGLTFWLGYLVAGRAAAILAGLATALSAPLLVMEHYLMSEMLFSAFLVAGLIAFVYARQRGQYWPLAVTGALLGCAALTRPIAQIVLVLLALWLIWHWRSRWRRALVGLAVLLVAFGAVTAPWMARNRIVHGAFAVAGGLGEGLAVRTIRYDQRFDFRPPVDGDQSETLRGGRRIYRDEAGDGSAFELAARLRGELNLGHAEADALMRQIAVEAISRQPGYYLVGTFEMFGRMLLGRPVRLRQDWTPWRGMAWDSRINHLLPRATELQESEFGRAELFASLYEPSRVWPLVLGLAALGALLGGTPTGRGDRLLLAVIVVSTLLSAAALVGLEWRYRYPLDPLINVLAASGVASLAPIVQRISRHGRG